MLAVQSLPCYRMSEPSPSPTTSTGQAGIMCDQPVSVSKSISRSDVESYLNSSHSLQEGERTLVDQSSAYYFKFLIRKYKRQMGDMDGNVCSGGLQQYLIKEKEKQQQRRCEQNDVSQQQSKFECLPVDIRLHIFSYLSATELCSVSRVCRSWYDITEDNLLWAGLMERDIHKWDVIGHNTNPAIYKEVESEWSNKEIYLRCSPEVNRMMHQQHAMFSNISSILRYFLPKKTPMFAMFGPGLETQTSKLVQRIMHESEFEKTALYPGKFDGVGGGITLRSPAGSQFHLSVLYSSSRKEREGTNRDRNQFNRMMRENKDATTDERYELLPAVQDFCKTVDGFIYVVDATLQEPAVETGLIELLAIVSERWSSTHIPVLVLSTTKQPDTQRLSCFEVIDRLNLSQLGRPWQVRNCDVETRSGVLDGFKWLSEQTQRR